MIAKEQSLMRKNLFCGIVGMKYHEGAQERLEDLKDGETLTLDRQPENPHDSNAVAICNIEGEFIGFIPAAQAVFAAELYDKGLVRGATFSKAPPPKVVIEYEVEDEPDSSEREYSSGSGI